MSRERFSAEFKKLQDHIMYHVDMGREKSIALTKLEEAHMWLEKALLDQDGTLPLPEEKRDNPPKMDEKLRASPVGTWGIPNTSASHTIQGGITFASGSNTPPTRFVGDTEEVLILGKWREVKRALGGPRVVELEL